MPQMLRRAITRQRAIRDSRDFAWVLFSIMVPVACVGAAGVFRSIELAGTPVTAGGIVGGLVGLLAAWAATHFAQEAIRLGRLMKDSEQIMRVEEFSDLASGVRWSGLNPFSRWRR